MDYMDKKIETPECDKFLLKKESANEISMFLNFLSEKGITLCEFCNESGQYQNFHATDLAKSKLIATLKKHLDYKNK